MLKSTVALEKDKYATVTLFTSQIQTKITSEMERNKNSFEQSTFTHFNHALVPPLELV
jgi:hypothetical protein